MKSKAEIEKQLQLCLDQQFQYRGNNNYREIFNDAVIGTLKWVLESEEITNEK